MKLNINAFGLSSGILWALFAACYAGFVLFGWHSPELYKLIEEFHLFKLSGWGSVLLITVEHFVFGYLLGALFAFFYNFLISKKS